MQLSKIEINYLSNLEITDAISVIDDSIIKISTLLLDARIDDVSDCNNWRELQTAASIAQQEYAHFSDEESWKRAISNCVDLLSEAQTELNDLIDNRDVSTASDDYSSEEIQQGMARYFQKLNVIIKNQLGMQDLSTPDSDDELDSLLSPRFR